MTRQQSHTDDTVTYLGIDVGTSATKAVIIAGDGTVLARSRVTHPAARGVGPGRADAAAWRSSVTAAVRELAPHIASVRGIGLDTHCPNQVPTNPKVAASAAASGCRVWNRRCAAPIAVAGFK